MELNLSGLDGQVNFASTLGRVMVDGGLKKLAHCNISRNSIGRQGCEKLMEGILSKQVPQLSHLDLSVCTLTDNGLNAICKRRALFLLKKAPVVVILYLHKYIYGCCLCVVHTQSFSPARSALPTVRSSRLGNEARGIRKNSILERERKHYFDKSRALGDSFKTQRVQEIENA